MLLVIEPHDRHQQWLGVADIMKAEAHEAAVIGFLKGYRAGVDWIYQPANREIVEALLIANIRVQRTNERFSSSRSK